MMISLSAVVTHLWQSTLFAGGDRPGDARAQAKRRGSPARAVADGVAQVSGAVRGADGARRAGRSAASARTRGDDGGSCSSTRRAEHARRSSRSSRRASAPRAGSGDAARGRERDLARSACSFVARGVVRARWRRSSWRSRVRPRRSDSGREVDALRLIERGRGRRVADPAGGRPIRRIEPGVFGVRRPILVWPRSHRRAPRRAAAGDYPRARGRARAPARQPRGDAHMVGDRRSSGSIRSSGGSAPGSSTSASARCDEVVVRLGHEPAGLRGNDSDHVPAVPRIAARLRVGRDRIRSLEAHRAHHAQRRSEALDAAEEGARVQPSPPLAVIAPFVVGVLNAPPVRAAADCAGAGQESRVRGRVGEVEQVGIAGKVSIQTQPGGRFTAENVTAAAADPVRVSAAGFADCLAGPNGWTTTASTSWRRRRATISVIRFYRSRRTSRAAAQLMLPVRCSAIGSSS